ncbi:hypothetical protein ACN28E_31725 [Archangium lansingense]|uniref:hypothetical protein n=1 Tax=Archangium lansingense TaxID=2995310 RepID=UPI003B7B2F04
MKIYETLAGAARFAGLRWQAAMAQGSEDEKRLWSYVGESRNFVHVTGQIYRFEDYLRSAGAWRALQGKPSLER